MEGYALAAVDWAGTSSGRSWTYSESIDALDDILVLVSESPELDVDLRPGCGAAIWARCYGGAMPGGGR